MTKNAEIKVLHVCECLPGGPASYLQEVLPAQIAEFGAGNVAVLVPRAQRHLLAGIEDLSVHFYEQEDRSAGALLRLAVELRRTLRNFRPAILHLHSTVSGAVGRLAALGMRRNLKMIYCAHGWSFDPDKRSRVRPVVATMEYLLSPLTDRIVNISPHEMAFMRNAGFAERRLKLIVTGIKDADPLPPPFNQPPWLKFIFIGRLDYQKGFDLLSAAVARLPGDVARITVVGNAVRNQSASVDTSSIEFLGWVPREQVADIIRDADAIVMPSRWEGLPLVALEAMRAGRALIASDLGAFKYILADGRSGVLADTTDPDFLLKLLGKYDRGDFRRMGANAREQFEQQYRAERMNGEIISLYRELVGL
jgi:glycosyltransferase involved in cell wall biosynthesis